MSRSSRTLLVAAAAALAVAWIALRMHNVAPNVASDQRAQVTR